MTAPAEDPAPRPLPRGSRADLLRLLGWLVADLVSIPFHLLIFLLRRGRLRRRFRRMLEESAP